MKNIERLRFLSVAFFSGFVGCAPVVDYPNADIALSFDSDQIRQSNLAGANGTFSLDPDLCYLIHITANHPEFNQAPTVPPNMPASELAQCPHMPLIFGQWKGAFVVGAEVEIAVPAISNMRFDLLAVPKSTLGGSCPPGFSLVAAPDSQNSGHTDVSPQINGVEIPESYDFGPDTIKIVGTVSANIVPGLNNLSLSPVLDPVSSTLGTNYFCDDGGNSGGNNSGGGGTTVGGGGNSGGSNTNNFVHLSAPAFIHPEMSGPNPATWRTSMSLPYAIFHCPLGTSQVSLSIQGLAAQVATCGALRPDVAIFQAVQMPSGWGTSTYMSQASFVGMDSNSTPISAPFNFQISFGPAFRPLCDEAYGGSCQEPTGFYGQLDSMFNTSDAVRFVGFRETPGDRGIFLSRSENASRKIVFIPLDDVNGQTTQNPFGWDNSTQRNTIFRNYNGTGPNFHYLQNFNSLVFASDAMSTALFFEPFNLPNSPFVVDVNQSPFNFGTYQKISFAQATNHFIFSGTASSQSETWISSMSSFPGASKTRLSGPNMAGNFSFPNKLQFQKSNSGGFFLGAFSPDISVGPDKISFVTCVDEAACSLGGPENWTGRNISTFNDIIDFAVSLEDSNNFRLWILREGYFASLIVNASLVSPSFSNLTPTFIPFSDGVNSGSTLGKFYPMPQSFQPKLIRTVPKTNHQIGPNNPGPNYDLIIAGNENISGSKHSSIYRSADLGINWYRVHFNSNPGTEIVDALEVERQDRVYNSNGPSTSVHNQKTIAFLEFRLGSPNSYKILYQEHNGF